MLRVLIVSFLFSELLLSKSETQFPFIGLSVSSQNMDMDLDELEKERSFILKYGKQTLDWRTTFSYTYTQNAYQSIAIEVDKILLDNLFGTPKLRPYLGAVAGYMKFDDKQLDKRYDNYKSAYYGANFGFIIYATDNIDIDLGYHYYYVNDLDFLDNIHGATFAIHYFF
ncbi:MAG: hypothetical protein U9O24_06800 [Campylobacterota bacterium]|nr:hypothetical protein [Campylobacterota bacterium]